VKEFAKLVQKWTFTPNPVLPLLGMNSCPQPNLNSLILSILFNRETAMKQQQDLLAHNFLQQINPNAFLEMLNQTKQPSGQSSALEKSHNSESMSVLPPFRPLDHAEIVEPRKTSEREGQEMKDEVETIQSSEDKSNRVRTFSEETANQGKKIDLEQAYSILNKNSFLSEFLKNHSSAD
jgi:hypothetical protein